MDDIRQRLDQNLTAALVRLRQLGGAVAVEELPGAIGDNSRIANEIDESQGTPLASPALCAHVREMLLERVNRLSAALERLNDGGYGVCVECAGRITPARLRAVPEVLTCIRCQDRIERFERPM